MRGCAGAGSTQARTLICMSPPLLTLHPCLDLYGFRVLSNSDRAPVFVFVFRTCLDQAGARFVLGLARGFLCLFWALPGVRRAFQLDLSRLECARFGFGSGSRPLASFRWSCGWIPSNPERMDLSRPDGSKLGLGLKLSASSK